MHRDLDHLLLEDDHAVGLAEDRTQQVVGEGDLVFRVLTQLAPTLHKGVDGTALDRTGPDQGDLDGQVIDVVRQHPRQHLHLGPALDLENPGGLGPFDHPEDLAVVEVYPAQVHGLAAGPVDLVDGPLDR